MDIGKSETAYERISAGQAVWSLRRLPIPTVCRSIESSTLTLSLSLSTVRLHDRTRP